MTVRTTSICGYIVELVVCLMKIVLVATQAIFQRREPILRSMSKWVREEACSLQIVVVNLVFMVSLADIEEEGREYLTLIRSGN